METFVGQILLVGFNFAPVGWHFCDGSLLPISEYDVLFNLLGTTYGGDGVSTFGLPDLRGKTAIGIGTGPGLSAYVLGQTGGVEQVSIGSQTYPTHTHALTGTTDSGTAQNPSASVLATGQTVYKTESATVGLNPATCGNSPGGSVPHENRQPFQTCNWIISLFGVYPTQS
jgi:microcystin-dependent protein